MYYGDWKSIIEAVERADPTKMAEAAPQMAAALIGFLQATKGTKFEEKARVSVAMAYESLKYIGLHPPE